VVKRTAISTNWVTFATWMTTTTVAMTAKYDYK
jgi:hypothetical protein